MTPIQELLQASSRFIQDACGPAYSAQYEAEMLATWPEADPHNPAPQ